MMKHFITFTLLLLAAGCSGKVSLTGKVTFSDDGAPVTYGFIMFESAKESLRAKINLDGTYAAGSLSQNDGVLPGQYRVRLIFTDVANPDAKPAGKAKDGEESGGYVPQGRIRTIDPKYEQATTSGLVVDVKGGTVYNFTVDRCPPEKQKFQR
ncbi:MAG: hypothetical protein LBT46_02640 [Planctomycetaceae bacterium]|nr:hypothetical protein [Planctomycetaceae bacterium]